MILAMLSIIDASAQDVRYYKLTRKMENGKPFTDVSGGQYITFIADICYESDKKGIGVGHGNMKRNKSYSTSEYTTYFGSSYWGDNVASFKFNADKSVLNVVIDKNNYYIYKRATAPAGQETCSLIRKKTPTNQGGGGSEIVVPSTPIVLDPYNPTPTPDPKNPEPNPPTPQPKRHQCGLCGGSGETIKTDGISFGNTKYCEKCRKTVPDNHRHGICESCGGKGWW